MTVTRRAALAVGALFIVSGCGPIGQPKPTATPTTASSNITSPRGLTDHGVQDTATPDDVARKVSERLVVRDGTSVQQMTAQLVTDGLLVQDAPVQLKAQGLDSTISETFRAGAVLTLSEPSAAAKYGENPDSENVIERTVTMHLTGRDPSDSTQKASFEAVTYVVVVRGEDGIWRADDVKALRFTIA